MLFKIYLPSCNLNKSQSFFKLLQNICSKKKKTRKLGKQPPAHPLGKVAAPEEREPPSWGTNLVEIKDIPKVDEPEQAPASKGAIPKTKKSIKVPVAEDVFEDFEQAVLDYRTGEISMSPRRRRRELVVDGGNDSILMFACITRCFDRSCHTVLYDKYRYFENK